MFAADQNQAGGGTTIGVPASCLLVHNLGNTIKEIAHADRRTLRHCNEMLSGYHQYQGRGPLVESLGTLE